MKYKIHMQQFGWMVLFMAVLFLGHVNAAPQFSAPSLNVIAGNQLLLPITVHDVDESCAGLNATLSLPNDVTCSASARGSLTASDGYWDVRGGGTGMVSIVVWSASDAFQANRGIVFELGMNVASNAVPGTYPVSFVAGRTGISNADGSSSITHTTSNGWLTIDIDTDGDGNGDNWELTQFGSLTNATASSDSDGDGLLDVDEFAGNTDPNAVDSDGDGMNDHDETIAGTDPLNSADLLLAYIGVNNAVTVEWDSIAAKRYTLQESTNLVSGTWTNIHQTWGHGSVRSFSTTNDSPASYYRVQVVD